MRKLLVSALLAATLAAAPRPSAADTGSTTVKVATTIDTITFNPIWIYYLLYPTWKCVHADGTSCTTAEMQNPWYKQILFIPTGYQESDRVQFWTDFDTMRNGMINAGNAWSTQKKNQILWVGYFLPGNPLGPTANFGADVEKHPVRGLALALNLGSVYNQVASLQASVTGLRPLGTMVIFNTVPTDSVTANAAPPSFTGRAFGIAKMTRKDLDSPYIATHELAHAALNFLDEYVESGMEELNIHSVDPFTPLAQFDGSWSGAISAIQTLIGYYDIRISDILAANGNVNIATTSTPSTVWSPISAPQSYGFEGGMFFGRGTFHEAGDNIMNGNHVVRGTGDRFAYNHSPNQQAQINAVFNGGAPRANDRLRNEGPDEWPLALGSSTHVIWYDGDKLNHAFPTQYYVVEVGWWEREWYTAWWGPFPYPAYRDVWKTAQKYVWPGTHTLNLATSALWGIASFAQGVVCELGVLSSIGGFKICEQPLNQTANNFIPALNMTFYLPYEETDVPASQWFTSYWWHMATWNGTTYSGWTGWSSFYRSF